MQSMRYKQKHFSEVSLLQISFSNRKDICKSYECSAIRRADNDDFEKKTIVPNLSNNEMLKINFCVKPTLFSYFVCV